MALCGEGVGSCSECWGSTSRPERCGRSVAAAAHVSARTSGGDEPPSDRTGRRRELRARGARHVAAARGGGLAAGRAGRAPAGARRRPPAPRPGRPHAHRLRGGGARARRLARRRTRREQDIGERRRGGGGGRVGGGDGDADCARDSRTPSRLAVRAHRPPLELRVWRSSRCALELQLRVLFTFDSD